MKIDHPMDHNAIEVENLCFAYPNGAGVANVSFELRPGRPTTILGRNGAGKSTIMKLLAGTLSPAAGSIHGVQGRRLGYLPEERGLYPQLSVQNHLAYFARMAGVKPVRPAVDTWLNRLGISQYRTRPARSLSKGNAQKLQIGMCLISTPDLVIMDEPFTGLDPMNRDLLVELINDVSPGAIMLLSGHDIELLSVLCVDAIVVNDGQIVASGPVEDLRQHAATRALRIDGKELPVQGNHIHQAVQALNNAVDQGFDGEFSYTYPRLEEAFRTLSEDPDSMMKAGGELTRQTPAYAPTFQSSGRTGYRSGELRKSWVTDMRRRVVFREVVRLTFLLMMRSWMTWLFTALIAIAAGLGCWWAGGHISALTTSSAAVVGGGTSLFAAYLFAVLGGGLISTFIALERTSKVEEILMTHISAVKLALAKYCALGLLLLTLAAVLVAELFVLHLIGLVDLRTLFTEIGFSILNGGSIAIVGACTLAAVMMYAILYGIAGTFVHDVSEIQMAQLPITVILLPCFIVSLLATQNPAGHLAGILTYIPLTSPFIFTGRLISGDLSPLSGGLASAFYLITVTLLVWFMLTRLRQPSRSHSLTTTPTNLKGN